MTTEERIEETEVECAYSQKTGDLIVKRTPVSTPIFDRLTVEEMALLDEVPCTSYNDAHRALPPHRADIVVSCTHDGCGVATLSICWRRWHEMALVCTTCIRCMTPFIGTRDETYQIVEVLHAR